MNERRGFRFVMRISVLGYEEGDSFKTSFFSERNMVLNEKINLRRAPFTGLDTKPMVP